VFLLGSTPRGAPRFSAPTSHVLVLGPPRSGKTTGFVKEKKKKKKK
jgi:type IV secretory pathway TraG/TraD family ATPase VirD4